MVIHGDPGGGNTTSSPGTPTSIMSHLSESDPSDPLSGGGSEEPPAKKQKTIAPQRRWIFTWNNYPEEWQAHFSVHQAPEGRLHGWMGEREIGKKTGTPHIQGWIDFGLNNKGRPFALKMAKQISWRKMKGTPQQNFNYCSKEDPEFAAWGTAKLAEPFHIEIDWSIHPWHTDCYNYLQTPPNSRDIYWIYELIGNAGKTFFCKWYEYAHPEQVLVLAGKSGDMKNGIVEWKEKTGTVPRVVLVLLTREKSNHQETIAWSGIEEVKDMLFYSGKFHGGMVNDKHPHLVFFANSRPQEGHLSGDRLTIVEIPPGKERSKPKELKWGFPKEYAVEQLVEYVPAKFPGFVYKNS